MSILDDAIREHLELKRQHGAGSDDLERLEKEAFGPPTRPGDPDFVDDAQVGGDPAAAAGTAGATVLASGTAPAPAVESTAAAPGTEAPATRTEQARGEHAGLGDTADHPAPVEDSEEAEPPAAAAPGREDPPPLSEPLPPSDSIDDTGDAEAAPAESTRAEPPEAPERGIFDAEDIDFSDFDLDFDEEDEGSVAPQPAAPEASPLAASDDDLSLDLDADPPPRDVSTLPSAPAPGVPRNPVVEDDTDNPPPLPVPPRGDDPISPPPAPPAEEPPGEDLLEETPEFLRDTPEGDRAWFEQDPPKDFDFDD